MKQLIKIAIMAIMLTSCNKSKIPTGWLGSWFAVGGYWQCSLFEEVAIYNNDVWNYQSIKQNGDSLSVVISNNERLKKLCFVGKKEPFTITESANGEILEKRTKKLITRAQYFEDDKLISWVCKDRVNLTPALSQLDSLSGISQPIRIEPKFETPNGTIGEAVVRLYVRNSFRGPESIKNYEEFLSDECYVLFDNRIETSKRKMELVRSDQHGKLFEAKIPVDGIADFYFVRNKTDEYQFYQGGYFDFSLKYFAAQNDTTMVVVNLAQNDRIYYGNCGNYYRGFRPFSNKAVDFNINDSSIITEDDFWQFTQSYIDSILRVCNSNWNFPSFNQYKPLLYNELMYNAASLAINFVNQNRANQKMVSDAFFRKLQTNYSIADSAILKTSQSIEYAYLSLFSQKVQTNECSNFCVIDHAKGLGFSQKAADVLAVRYLEQQLNLKQIVTAKAFLTDEEYQKQTSKIESLDYRNYLGIKYKDYACCRDYISRAKTECNLTDDDFADFEHLTNKTSVAILRDIQAGCTNVDVQPPYIEFLYDGAYELLQDNKCIGNVAYLVDNYENNKVVDSAYSSAGYFIFGNLEQGKTYGIIYGVDTTWLFVSNAAYVSSWNKPLKLN